MSTAPAGIEPEDHDKLQSVLGYHFNPATRRYFKELPSSVIHMLCPNPDGSILHRVRLVDKDRRPRWFENTWPCLDDALFSAKLINLDREPFADRGPRGYS